MWDILDHAFVTTALSAVRKSTMPCRAGGETECVDGEPGSMCIRIGEGRSVTWQPIPD